jgi:hypothetical protein
MMNNILQEIEKQTSVGATLLEGRVFMLFHNVLFLLLKEKEKKKKRKIFHKEHYKSDVISIRQTTTFFLFKPSSILLRGN